MLKLFKISFHIIIIAMMLMLTLVWFWKNDAFELKAAKIQGNRYLNKEEIFELAGIDFSKDIFQIDTDEIEIRILNHPMIEKVSVTRFLPSALKIKVKERDLIAAISGSEISVVDRVGNILSQYPPKALYDLPVITGFHFHTGSSGIRIVEEPELMQQAINALNEIKSLDLVLYHEVSELHYSRTHGFIFYLNKSNLPVIFGKENFKRRVVRFSSIYHYLVQKSRLKDAQVIDLRFKDQVVVRSKT
ncbi:MAG: FtsQ-type POTRA domain-containing protein [bacterium]|nr:MAG: FtsQ-type POTRA domain-containing protein [bacterium]